MKLNVPYYSQYTDVADSDWQPRACAIACLKMALDFEADNFDTVIPSLDKLIKEGIDIDAFNIKEGWSHMGMVFISHNHGVPAYREEFRSMYNKREQRLVTIGHAKILRRLEEGKTSIVSVEGNFKDGGESHQVLIVGHEDGDFIYHEPSAKDGTGSFRHISEEEFLRHWRHLAIFIG